jgi:hypothetical protein
MILSRTNPPSILSILCILSKKQSQPRLNGVAMSSSPREQVNLSPRANLRAGPDHGRFSQA